MKCERIELRVPGARLETYFQDVSPELPYGSRRPLVLLCPGGGYARLSDREAEPVALAFMARGFQACVLRYPCAPVRYPAALCALAEGVAWLRAHAAENHTDPRQISVCGFSAGGHLAGCLGVYWDQPFLAEQTGFPSGEMRPDRLVLCYPVITSGPFAHRPSIDNLAGADAPEALLRELSLELQVSAATPPVFLWHTRTDPTVPVENSLLFADALQKAGVPFEAHIYSVGGHGLSLATEETAAADGRHNHPECAGWIDLAAAWLRR